MAARLTCPAVLGHAAFLEGCFKGLIAARSGAGARLRRDEDVQDPEAHHGCALARAVGARGRGAHRLRADPVPLLVRRSASPASLPT